MISTGSMQKRMQSSNRCTTPRNTSGVSLIILAVLIMLALTTLGFFSTELWHAYVVRQQLGNVCDAAGLATASALASSSYPSLIANKSIILNPSTTSNQYPTQNELQQARLNSAAVGFEVFRQNTICGQSLATTNTFLASNDSDFQGKLATLKPGQTIAVFDYYDQKPTLNMPTDPINGKHVQVTAATSVTPLFGVAVLGNQTTVQAVGHSASAMIDLAFMLDTALRLGSETNMYIVRREYNYTPNLQAGDPALIYTAATVTPTPGQQASNPGQRDNMSLVSRPQGSVCPQYIDESMTVGGGNFDALLRGTVDNDGLPATVLNTGTYPGNYQPAKPPLALPSQDWTDAVVLPSGNDNTNMQAPYSVAGDTLGTILPAPVTFTYQGQTYAFPNIATMVEASRGNLDSETSFYRNVLKPMARKGLIPSAKSGYQAAYQAYGEANCEPFHSECVQITNFFTLMNANTDAHIAIIPYSLNPGTPLDQPGTETDWDIGPVYSLANSSTSPPVGESKKNPNFPDVEVTLELNTDPNMIQNLYNALSGYHQYAYSSAALGFQQAYSQLTGSNSRLGAKKMAMLISDGEPTDDTAAPWPISGGAATQLGTAGIPLYGVAFLHPQSVASQGTSSTPFQFMAQMSSDCANASPGGQGSTAFVQTEQNMAQLQQIFRQTSHQFVTLE